MRDLNKLTKADMQYVIAKLRRRYHITDEQIEDILLELEYHKEGSRLNEAEECNRIIREKTKQYEEIIKKYRAPNRPDISSEDRKKLVNLLVEINEAEEKQNKLLGISNK